MMMNRIKQVIAIKPATLKHRDPFQDSKTEYLSLSEVALDIRILAIETFSKTGIYPPDNYVLL